MYVTHANLLMRIPHSSGQTPHSSLEHVRPWESVPSWAHFFPFFFFFFLRFFYVYQVFPIESVVNNLPVKSRHMSSILQSRRYPGEGNGNPIPYSCLDKPMDRGVYSPQGCKRIRHDLAAKQHYFKVFTEFVTILLLFYVLGFWLWGKWDLNSPARGQTCTHCIGRWSLSHWTAREVSHILLLMPS